MKYLKRSLLFGIISALFLIEHSEARSAESAFMQTLGRTRPPIGHVQFCKVNPGLCQTRVGQDKAMVLTQDRWNELIRINHMVNQSVLPVRDQDLYNAPEVWTFPERYGDCEDYVLLKRHYLISSGWPEGSLLITVVRDIDGGGHAVLTVRTDRGDFILDNQDVLVQHWTETPYAYIKRQSSKHPAQWVTINDARGTVGTTATTN